MATFEAIEAAALAVTPTGWILIASGLIAARLRENMGPYTTRSCIGYLTYEQQRGMVLLDVFSLVGIVAAILWLVFGEVTVRRLRKNPETRGKLGAELYSGWDIVTVAQALSMPKWLARRSGTLYGMLPDTTLLYRHTTKFDRILARAFYWTGVVTTLGLLSCVLLSWIAA
jgi:hypothetical protein